MYEKFTDGTRLALKAANSLAQTMNHEYIGTEHMLLGLLEDLTEWHSISCKIGATIMTIILAFNHC